MSSPVYKTPRIMLTIGILIVILLLINVGVTIYLGRSTSYQQYAPSAGNVQNLIKGITFQFGSRNESNKVPQTLLDEGQMADFMQTGFYSMSSYGSVNAHLEKTDLSIGVKESITIALSSENATNISVCERGRSICSLMSKHKFSQKPAAVVLQVLPNQLKVTTMETFGSLKEGIYESDPTVIRFD